MTGVRESFIFALEDGFSKGKGANTPWIAPPPGSFFNSGHNRQATKIYTVGSKFFDTVAYGQLNGTFNWTFVFDYHYLEPLQLAFEKVECVPNADGTHYTHTFEKVNNAKVPSFTVRRKILNRMAGGPDHSDEITELRGCVVRNISFSKAAGTSQLQVTFTGFYADEVMYKGDLDATDYKEYDGKLSEYLCMFVGQVGNDGQYVANTESLEFTLENNSDAIYNTCSPFAGLYYEGRTNVTFGTTCYSNDPSHYKQRVYSGGFRNDVFKPMAKGLKPIPKISLVAYDKSVRDDEYGDTMDFTQALADSDESFLVEIDHVVIKSLTWPKGNDQKLQDTISSAECRNIKFTIVNTINDAVDGEGAYTDMRYNNNNVVSNTETYGYGVILVDPEGQTPKPNALISVTEGGVQVIKGLPTMSPTTANPGTWGGWWTKMQNDAGEGMLVTDGMTIASNQTLFAHWTHTVTFNTLAPATPGTKEVETNVGSGTLLSASSTETGNKAPADPIVTGYTFGGWYTETGGAGVKYTFPSDPIYKDMELNSYMYPNTYAIIINKNGGTSDGEAFVDYDATAVTNLVLPVYSGKVLNGIYDASSSGNKIINADGTLNTGLNDNQYVTSGGKWCKDASESVTLYAQWSDPPE